MTLTPLSAISPIDGRYRNTTAGLAGYFSEYALIKYRVFVEIEYFIALCEYPLPQLQDFDKKVSGKGRKIGKASIENIILNTIVPILVCYAKEKDNND